MDSSMVVETIQKLNTDKNVKNSNYATSLSGHSVIIKKITLPAMSPEELAESIQWEAEQYIPFDINDVNLDYVPLTTPGTGDNIDVILVAVKKEKINDYTSVISQTGKVPVLVGDYTIQQVKPILTSVRDDFEGDLRKTLDFFAATSGADRFDEIALAGGGSGVLNLDAIQRDKYGIPVGIMDPFQKVTIDEKEFNPEELAEIGPSMAIAVGLAMRKLGDA